MNEWVSSFFSKDTVQRNTLVLKCTFVNIVGSALLLAAWAQGWIPIVVKGDTTNLVLGIITLFGVGLALVMKRAMELTKDIDEVKLYTANYNARVRKYAHITDYNTLRLTVASSVASIKHIGNSLVFLGLIGTVIGFIIALSGVDPATAQDVETITPMVSTLINGMSVALYTTLVGAVLNIWLMTNYRVLENGCVELLIAIMQRRKGDDT